MAGSRHFVYLGDTLARYHFGQAHPFGPYRHGCFESMLKKTRLDQAVDILAPVMTDRQSLLRFHSADYIDKVMRLSEQADGYLDGGDTPAFSGMFQASCTVAGSLLDGIARIMQQEYRSGFVPIAGLHHARRDSAAGFCVINDCGIAIETLFQVYGLTRVAYVDIDAHHGDGVFYSFESDPRLVFADTHEDGRVLYPGTGDASETGKGDAAGSKLNIPLAPGSDDAVFLQKWPQVEALLRDTRPEFILLQCGADSIKGDPITHLELSPKAHWQATASLVSIAAECCQGRLLAVGGGGYNCENIARGWTAVVAALTGGTV